MGERQKAAIVYDFDGTLAPGNMQEHSFIPALGIDAEAFWSDVKRVAKQHDADEILVYMWLMLARAKDKGLKVDRESLITHGAKTPLFAGVPQWFDRIEEFATKRGLELEHYIISSGIREMIEGCAISKRFKQIFASRFAFDEAGNAIWPAVAINYTTKTQFLFRINKGIDNTWDTSLINKWQPYDERPVPFPRMIFIGDGETDIPAMKMIRHQGGYAIAVFDPEKWAAKKLQDRVHTLVSEDRVQFVAPADYQESSQLDVTIKGVLGRIARECGYRE